MKNIAIISIVIITIFLSSCSDHKEADGGHFELQQTRQDCARNFEYNVE